MPYDAWLVVASGMREARTKGLFGDWVGNIKCGRRIETQVVAEPGIEPGSTAYETVLGPLQSIPHRVGRVAI